MAGTGAPLYAPSLGYFLNGGAIWDGTFPVNVEVGQTAQITLQGYGNEPPTYSVVSGPSSVSIDPNTGVISISPMATDATDFTAIFEATNSLGSVVSKPLAVHVLALPTVVVPPSMFTFDGQTHDATAVAYGSDGVTPIAGSFRFEYAPVVYPTAHSTSPYGESGSYIAFAYFTSTDPDYGNAVGTGPLTIAPAVPTIIVNDGSFGFDGFSHPASATAVGLDGATPIDGTFTFTYNGSADEPTSPGTYAVLATFTSNVSDYANTVASGKIGIGTQSAPSTTITVGTTETYTLSGSPTGGGLTHVINNSTAGTGLNRRRREPGRHHRGDWQYDRRRRQLADCQLDRAGKPRDRRQRRESGRCDNRGVRCQRQSARRVGERFATGRIADFDGCSSRSSRQQRRSANHAWDRHRRC